MKQFCLIFLLASALPAIAQPSRIYLIRHGEKLPDHQSPHLTPAGQQRAGHWAAYFTNSLSQLPAALFAPQPTPDHPSVRAQETLAPLAKCLHLEVRTPFVATNYAQLARNVLADDKLRGQTVAICWVHQSLPQLTAAFGVQPQPPAWNPENFDQVYLITFEQGRARLTVTHGSGE